MINRVVLIGRLTHDPELRTTSTGKSVVNFSLAVPKRFKPTDGSGDAEFFKITAWEKTAEYVAKYLTKGRLCAVDGRLSQRSYNDSNDNKREAIEVIAEQVQGLDRPREELATPGASGSPDITDYNPFDPEEMD